DTFHQGVDAAPFDERARPPDVREQRVAAKDYTGVRRQLVQQAKFLIGELDVASAQMYSAPCRVDDEAVCEHRPSGNRCRGLIPPPDRSPDKSTTTRL